MHFLVAKVYKKYENRGIFDVKKYVNVYRFLRKYSVFTFRRSVFSVPLSAVSEAEGTKKVQYPAPFCKRMGILHSESYLSI